MVDVPYYGEQPTTASHVLDPVQSWVGFHPSPGADNALGYWAPVGACPLPHGCLFPPGDWSESLAKALFVAFADFRCVFKASALGLVSLGQQVFDKGVAPVGSSSLVLLESLWSPCWKLCD